MRQDPLAPVGSPAPLEGGKTREIVALLVEDNRPDVLLVQEAIDLHNLPIALHVAADGEEAFRFIERAETDPEAPCPEVLVLDLNLPRRNGKEVLERVRASEKCRHIPTLIMTSSDLPKEREELAKLGANRYFKKPSSYEQFLTIGEVLKEVLQDLSISGQRTLRPQNG